MCYSGDVLHWSEFEAEHPISFHFTSPCAKTLLTVQIEHDRVLSVPA